MLELRDVMSDAMKPGRRDSKEEEQRRSTNLISVIFEVVKFDLSGSHLSLAYFAELHYIMQHGGFLTAFTFNCTCFQTHSSFSRDVHHSTRPLDIATTRNTYLFIIKLIIFHLCIRRIRFGTV